MAALMNLLETTPLRAFLAEAEDKALPTADCVGIIDHAERLLEQFYVHLTQKRSLHATDPIQRLRALRHRLLHSFTPRFGWAFHEEMMTIFTDLRDLHTRYLPPPPYQGKVAFLPLLIEEYYEDGKRVYLVSKVLGSIEATLAPGAIVTTWNGIPIDLCVTRNAARQAGSNADARHARGLEALTVRPLGMTFPPDEDWVVIGYRDLEGASHEVRLEWRVTDWESFQRAAHAAGEGEGENEGANEDARGLDTLSEVVQHFKRSLVRGGSGSLGDDDAALTAGEGPAAAAESSEDAGPRDASRLPGNFAFRVVQTPSGEFGQIRVWSFENVMGVRGFQEAFVTEFIRILGLMPERGVILDVRGNPGGQIPAGERLLELLSPRPIEGARLQFPISEGILALVRNGPPSLRLGAWKDSIDRAIETGATHTQGYPFLPYSTEYNLIGQVYHGPVLLVVDALCYSTTDVFVAGFQDHRIGPILGTGTNIGAGGANMWTSEALRRFLPDDAGLAAVPGGASFTVALRRTLRVGDRAGLLLEDLGVVPNYTHRLTRADILEQNRDLLARAGEILSRLPWRRLRVAVGEAQSGESPLTIETRGLDRVDVYVDDRPRASLDVRDGETTTSVPTPAGDRTIVLRGFKDGEWVATRREDITVPG